MGRTIETALSSILTQIDESYEVVVVDDGSSDNSREILTRLSQTCAQLRLVFLERRPNRHLGWTRNVSVREARGEYCMLHLDADDVWRPHIDDFAQVFRKIEDVVGPNFLLDGKQMQMGRRDFLLRSGPYRNLQIGEDRDLWLRLAEKDQLISLEHERFVVRLPLTRFEKLRKSLKSNPIVVREELRTGTTTLQALRNILQRRDLAVRAKAYRLLALPYAIVAAARSPLGPPYPKGSVTSMAEYRREHAATYPDLMRRLGASPRLDFLGAAGQRIFLGAEP